MADSLHVGDNRRKVKRSMACGNAQPKKSLVASIPKHCSKALQRIVIVDQNQSILGMGTVSEIGHFLLKLAVLEAVRRISDVYCPVLWQSLQALQCVCLPPLKWIQKWSFFKGFVKCMQVGPLANEVYACVAHSCCTFITLWLVIIIDVQN